MKIAFNTANLVGRATDYRFKLADWGKHDALTVEKTDEREWNAICADVAAAGYTSIELWQAHASPQIMTEERAAQWKEILRRHGLTAIAFAGSPSAENAQVCKWLGIPMINGGLWGVTIEEAETACRNAGIQFNYENHPETSVAEILERVGGGNETVGVCLDTGWLGAQGVDAAAAVRELGPLVRHVHLKDVKQKGGHETCLLGEGIVKIAAVMDALRETGYTGWYSWEDEPEDRNPLDSAVENRLWIEQHLT